MNKKNNPYYIVEENENIDEIAKKCKKNAIFLLINNSLTPKDIKKGCVLFIE